MDDLISRDYLREIVGGMPTEWEYGAAVSDIYDIIMKAPAVDAVEVVRCKDCDFRLETDDGEGICPNIARLFVEDDFFCADGKRREEARA